ncbi:MAG: class I SAM-dependent methyltransferase [Chloroflexi bacterium]|nr:class I SAM-dependent methyltransferase [Chloroflexota bacterium]
MDGSIDWNTLWSELVELSRRRQQSRAADNGDRWNRRAEDFDSRVRDRWARPDSSRSFLTSALDAMPGSTVLDIGAGTGKWAVLLARHAKQVTAVEPSPAMGVRLRENIAAAGVSNVVVLEEAWPQASVGLHDITLCSHSLYGFPDFAGVIASLQAVTRRMCVLLLRAPAPDGIMAEAARRILGHPHDSPNYQIAFNALLQMGIFPNVLMEYPASWVPWSSDSPAEALLEIKRRFGLSERSDFDDYLCDLLQRRLVLAEGRYVWPQGMRTALIYWLVDPDNGLQIDYRVAVRPDTD